MNQEQFEATTSDDLRKMTPEELAAWFEWEPEPVPLTSFPLGSEEGRKAFLREFYGVGWDWLFLAVSHVWNSLAEPQSARCTAMGIAAGTGATGKGALVKVLSKFLDEALTSLTPLPARSDHASLETWHEASMATWRDDELQLGELLKIYADILNGGEAKVRPSSAEVLYGPWKNRPTLTIQIYEGEAHEHAQENGTGRGHVRSEGALHSGPEICPGRNPHSRS